MLNFVKLKSLHNELHVSEMKNKNKLITAAAVVSVTIGIVVLLYGNKKRKNSARLDQIADEGYETAGDILFPTSLRYSKRKYESWKN